MGDSRANVKDLRIRYGREDLNLRPIGPEATVYVAISECFRSFSDSGSNWVLPGRGQCAVSPATAAHRLTVGGAKIVWTMNYQDRIVRDPQIVGGEPILKGTRVTLKSVLASLAEGATTNEILADFPTLSEEDVRAAIAFAAGSAQEDMPLIETPIKR